jgi:hypothetical protein
MFRGGPARAQDKEDATIDNGTKDQNPNTLLITLIAVLAGLNAIVLSSDLSDAFRYALTGLSTIGLAFCAYKLTSTWRKT